MRRVGWLGVLGGVLLLAGCFCGQEGGYTSHGAPTGEDPAEACRAVDGGPEAVRCEAPCDAASCPVGFTCNAAGYCEHDTIPNCLRCR